MSHATTIAAQRADTPTLLALGAALVYAIAMFLPWYHAQAGVAGEFKSTGWEEPAIPYSLVAGLAVLTICLLSLARIVVPRLVPDGGATGVHLTSAVAAAVALVWCYAEEPYFVSEGFWVAVLTVAFLLLAAGIGVYQRYFRSPATAV